MSENWRAVRGNPSPGQVSWHARYRGPDGEWCTVRTASSIVEYSTASAAEAVAKTFYDLHRVQVQR